MSSKRFYFPWLAPLYRRVPFERFLSWQSRFLTEEGARKLALELLPDSAEEITFVRGRTRWTVDVRDVIIGFDLFMYPESARMAENAILEWAHAHGRLERATILEIGANIGSSTVPLLQGSACRIIAVEPVPRNRALLERNLRQNDLAHRAIIVPRAIADRAESVEMIVPLDALGGSEISRRPVTRTQWVVVHPCDTVQVQTTRLDELMQSVPITPAEVAFVWCDAQGSEGAVIRTGAALWQAGVPLWAEIAPVLIARQDNLQQFIMDVTCFFAGYVPREELKTKGAAAPVQPIATFEGFVAQLTGAEQTDVLLLPREQIG